MLHISVAPISKRMQACRRAVSSLISDSKVPVPARFLCETAGTEINQDTTRCKLWVSTPISNTYLSIYSHANLTTPPQLDCTKTYFSFFPLE